MSVCFGAALFCTLTSESNFVHLSRLTISDSSSETVFVALFARLQPFFASTLSIEPLLRSAQTQAVKLPAKSHVTVSFSPGRWQTQKVLSNSKKLP